MRVFAIFLALATIASAVKVVKKKELKLTPSGSLEDDFLKTDQAKSITDAVNYVIEGALGE